MKYLYHVRVGAGLDYDCLADEEQALNPGEKVVIRCERYQDLGTIEACCDQSPVDEDSLQKKRDSGNKGRSIEGQKIPVVVQRADAGDLEKARENKARAETMQLEAVERVTAHGLDMKIIDTHCSLDRKLVVFQFTAEGRVDFRQLLRDLSHKFRTRVELRQIGVRDEAAVQGGIGSCGRAFCCATFLKRFSSINVKMAKVQGLSLNPTNISGACGRLKCCLQYEFELYRERLREEKRTREPDADDGSAEEAEDENTVNAATEEAESVRETDSQDAARTASPAGQSSGRGRRGGRSRRGGGRNGRPGRDNGGRD